MRKSKKNKIPSLKKGASEAEIIDWTTQNDVFDRLDSGETINIEDRSDLDRVLEDAVFQDNTAQLNIRIPPAMKTVLGRLARQRTTDASTLARIWLAERIQKELSEPVTKSFKSGRRGGSGSPARTMSR